MFRKYFFPLYDYDFRPAQLCYILNCIENTKGVEGSIVEIGCASGKTTIFMNKHLQSTGQKKPYHCIDTFSGFTTTHINYEVTYRQKKHDYTKNYSFNSRRWFIKTLHMNNIYDVNVHCSDATIFDYKSIAPISFCLLDVDLYIPTLDILPKIHELMYPGGIIVVDDCQSGSMWDGALQAYEEYTQNHNLPSKILHGKLGVIEL